MKATDLVHWQSSYSKANTYNSVQEVREIRFWFKSTVADGRRDELTEDFFKDLLNPTDFPTGVYSVSG